MSLSQGDTSAAIAATMHAPNRQTAANVGNKSGGEGCYAWVDLMRPRAYTIDMLVNAIAPVNVLVSQSVIGIGVTFAMRMTRKSLEKSARKARPRFLDGQMLIAIAAMQDERFSRSLIYMCAHSSEGAMGIVVNQPAANISFPDLLVKLDVIPEAEHQLPSRAGD